MGHGLSKQQLWQSAIPVGISYISMILMSGTNTIVKFFIGVLVAAITGICFGIYMTRQKCISDKKDVDYKTAAKVSSAFASISAFYVIAFIVASEMITSLGPIKIACMAAMSPLGVIIIYSIYLAALYGILNKSNYCKDKPKTTNN